MGTTKRSLIGALALLAALPAPAIGAEPRARDVYLAACANCHGADGRGRSQSHVGFDLPLPDFTDCDFASREPNADWSAVTHQGGPARGFSVLMPAFGEALDDEEIELALAHVRTFCTDENWPRGELNLPRPLFTEKAYPEDEAVLTVSAATEGPGAVVTAVVYEQRFGARNQLELNVPLAWREQQSPGAPAGEIGWTSGVGDIGVGVKRAFYHDLARGSIFSATAEIVLPTGDEDTGFGKGTAIFEPFVSYGQLLPAELFLHAQAGLELPFDGDRAEEEVFLRGVLGRTFTSGRWGRSWSPMLEMLGARELVAGADTDWDAVPQVQLTLNRRQHVMLNVGVRAAVNNTQGRDTSVVVYLLWDWFDGGLFAGW